MRFGRLIHLVLRTPPDLRDQLDREAKRYINTPDGEKLDFSPEVKSIRGMVTWGFIQFSVDAPELFVACLVALVVLPALILRDIF